MTEIVYDLRVDDLLRRETHAVLVDLDSTLAVWNNPDGTSEIRAWLDEMAMADVSVVAVSDNKHSRANCVVSRFSVDSVSRTMKPFTRGISMAIKRYGFDRGETIAVGNQLMMDICTTHYADIQSVSAKPLVTSDARNAKANRWCERRVWAKLEEKYGKTQHQRGI